MKKPKMIMWCVPRHLFIASTICGKHRSIARRLPSCTVLVRTRTLLKPQSSAHAQKSVHVTEE
jgi:hypothetical protein